MRVFPWVCYSRTSKVFFIDDNGALCARASGHAIDVESQLFPPFLSLVFYHSSWHCRRTPCPQASPPLDTTLPKRLFASAPTVPLSGRHGTSHRQIRERPRVCQRHYLARQDLLRNCASPSPPAHAPRRCDGRASLCVPHSTVLFRWPAHTGA